MRGREQKQAKKGNVWLHLRKSSEVGARGKGGGGDGGCTNIMKCRRLKTTDSRTFTTPGQRARRICTDLGRGGAKRILL